MTNVLKESIKKDGTPVRLVNDGIKLLECYVIEEFVKEKSFTGWRMEYGVYNKLSEAMEKFDNITA